MTSDYEPEDFKAAREAYHARQPKVGEKRKCLLCALEKPWGTWSATSGETVCVDCRDAAYAARTARRVGVTDENVAQIELAEALE